MKYLITFLFFSVAILSSAQAQNIYCNDDSCGALDPNWSLAGNQSVACEGETFTLLSDLSTPANNIDSYQWVLTEDGETLLDTTFTSSQQLNFVYNATDSVACLKDRAYIEVRLVVTSPNCATGESCRYIAKPLTVILKPRAKFTAKTVYCVGEEIDFRDISCNVDDIKWDFGDGDSSTDLNTSHAYDTPGTYFVNLNVSNQCGKGKATNAVIIVDEPEATIKLNNDGNTCTPGKQVITMDANKWVKEITGEHSWEISPAYSKNGDWVFINPDSVGTSNYFYQDEDLTTTTIDSLLSLDTVHVWFKKKGSYPITLNYGNQCGDKVALDTVHVFDPPSINGLTAINACDSTEVCFDDLKTLTINGQYQDATWTFIQGTDTTTYKHATDLDFGCKKFTENGIISLTLKANAPCNNITSSFKVNISQSGVVSIPDLTPNTICPNVVPIYLNPSVKGGSYEYNGSTFTAISGDTLYPENLKTGNYNITYISSNNPACPVSTTFSFTVQESPEIVLGENDEACESINNFSPAISSLHGNIDHWQWYVINEKNDTILTDTTNTPRFDIDTTGFYIIKAEITSNECGTVSDTSHIFIRKNITPAIDTFNNPYCQYGGADTLTAIPLGGTWTGLGIIDSDKGIFNPERLTPGTNDIYYTVTTGACTAIDTQTIEVVASEEVYARDTFFCTINTDTITLNVSPLGGVFKGNGIIDSINGLFLPSVGSIGQNKVTYFYTDSNQCDIVKPISVNIDSIPKLSIRDTISVCIGTENINLHTLANTSSNGVEGTFSYYGPGIFKDNGLFNGAALPEGFYTMYVEFDARACSTVDSFVVSLANKPNLKLPRDTVVCVQDETTSLYANIPGGIWKSLGSCAIDSNTGAIDLASIGETTCSFTYTLSQGTTCEQTDTIDVKVIDLSDNVFTEKSFSICQDIDTFKMTGFGTAGGVWTGPEILDSLKGHIDISKLKADSSYTYTYCIKSTEVDCPSCSETQLNLYSLPVAGFNINGVPCQNTSFSLENTSTNATKYLWNFGDGKTSTQAIPSHTYSSNGDYTIQLIAYTDFGCTDTFSQEVHVSLAPVLDANIITDAGCAPLNIEYTNNSSGENIQQFWVIQGIDTIYQAQPTIVLDSVQTDSVMTVELVVFNECDTLKKSKQITVHPYPNVDFGIPDDEGCSPDTVNFVNLTTGIPDNLVWTFGNGNSSTKVTPAPQVFTTPDDSISLYDVKLFASNVCGTDSLVKQVTVYPNNTEAFIELDTLAGCPPLTVNVRSYATPGSTVSYDFGDGATSTLANTAHTYTKPGKYVITQYATLCGMDSIKSDTIVVYPLANIDFEMKNLGCIGDTIAFTNLSTGGVASTWKFGDGNTSSVTNATHVFEKAGTYEVTLVVASENHLCMDSLTKTIQISGGPDVGFYTDTLSLCPNDTVQFTNTSVDAISYQWSFGDNSGSIAENPSHGYEKGGTYTVQLTAFDANGCSTDSTILNMLVHDGPTSQFALSDSTLCNAHDTLYTINNSLTYTQNIWSLNGSILPSTNDSISIPASQAGENEIQLISVDAFGCRDTSTNVFNVLPSPISESNIIDTTACQPFNITLSNHSPTADYITWEFDGETSGADTINHTFEQHGDFEINLIAGMTNGCPSDTQVINIKVNPRAIAKFEVDSYDICNIPKEISVTNLSEYSTSYLWMMEDSTYTVAEPTHTYEQTGNYPITLLANNAYNCPDTSQQFIDIIPVAKAIPNFTDTMGCQPLSLDFVNISAHTDNITWVFDGSTSNDSLLNHTFTETGMHEVQLIASSLNGCPKDTQTVNITVNPRAEAEFSIEPFDQCGAPKQVSFTNQSQNSTDYNWNFGNTIASDHVDPTTQYSATGDYAVQMIANNVHNCPDTSYQNVVIHDVPKAIASYADTMGCQPLSVSISNQSAHSDLVTWEFEGNTSNDSILTHTFTEDSLYRVQLIAGSTNGCPNDTQHIDIKVNPRAVAQFSVTSLDSCGIPAKVTLQDESLNSTGTNWDFNNGQTSNLNNPSTVYNTFGTQQIDLIATNAYGCADTTQNSIRILQTPEAIPSILDTAGCQPFTVDMSHASINTDWTKWVFDGNTSSNAQIGHTFKNDSTYYPQLIAGTNNGCPSDTQQIKIVVHSRAVAQFQVAPFDPCGTPVSVDMINQSKHGTGWIWDLGNGNTSSELNPSATYNSPNPYSISLIANNVYNCPDTTSRTLDVYPKPSANISLSQYEVCEGDSITIVNSSNNVNYFDWYMNGEAISGFPYHVTASGVYTVSLKANYNTVCADSLILEKELIVYDSPTSDFNAIVDEAENVIGDVDFLNLSIDSEEYLWDFGDGQTSNEESPSHEYNINGPHPVTLYTYHYNNDVFTCKDSTTQYIDIEAINTFFVPNAMSPEQTFGNGEVGIFKPKGAGVQAYELKIYSPWGDLVKTLSQVENGSPIDYWDGTSNGELVPQGAYLWTAKIEYLNGHREAKKGTITVLR